jgi:hypothetical protein
MSTRYSTTYARATLEYDFEHEQALMQAITEAIFATSMVSDCAAVIRTAETAEALLTVLACVLALSPAMTRSPTALRETVDGIGKRLRSKVSATEKSGALKRFYSRDFP